MPEFLSNMSSIGKTVYKKLSTNWFLTILTGAFIFSYSWIYRVAFRAIMDGAAFRWYNEMHVRAWGEDKTTYIYGAGTDGHFVIILLMLLLFLAILWLIICKRDLFTKILLTGWILIFLIWQLILSIGMGTEYVVHGDTLGITLPYYIIGPIEQLFVAVLATIWWIKPNVAEERNNQQVNSAMSIYAVAILVSYLISFVLLRFGIQDGLTDQLGIMLLYAQLIAIVLIFLPAGDSKRNQSKRE